MAGQRELAQVNVARLRYPADDPRLREFTGALARINAEAERAPGSSGDMPRWTVTWPAPICSATR